MIAYVTNFNLDYPVNDFKSAREYLLEDSMDKYLKAEPSVKDFADKIYSIDWILDNPMQGRIRLCTFEQLSEDELEKVSQFVKSQNDDGIGSGFSEQPFAQYMNPKLKPFRLMLEKAKLRAFGLDDFDFGDDEIIMAMFDTDTNNYTFIEET